MKRVATVIAIVMLWTSSAGAAVPGWAEQHPETLPYARFGAAMTYTPGYGYVTFGGTKDGTGASTLLATFQRWDGTGWVGIPTTTNDPPRRTSAQLAYDPDHGQTVLYGGAVWQSVTNDTWTFVEGAWKKRRSRVGDGHGQLVYDPVHHQLVLVSSGQMWKWNGKTWKVLPAVPPERYDGAIAFDGANLILFGGHVGSVPFNDTWKWTGKKWVELHPATSPPARAGAVMAQTASGLVLFGGRDEAWTPFGDTWTWDGTNWSPGTSGPSARGAAAAASDGTQVVMFGGSGTPEFMNDTWIWE